jgi:hypothetical protein
MMPRLRDEDRLAVDLLLDRAVTSSGGNGQSGTGFTPVNSGATEHVAKVQSLLRVLEMMPAEEPPSDLVAKTIRRVEAESAEDSSALRPPQPASDTYMPHA